MLAVIPARGGSVRVPMKNIKLLNDRPLIDYPIEAAKNSRFIDRIIVSTDSNSIRDVALSCGAEVPFTRPADISEDVPTEEVVIHTLEWLKENESYYPDVVVCLEPPKPFRTSEHIDECIEKIVSDEEIDSAITVYNVKGIRPEWMVKLDESNLIIPYSDYFLNQGKALLKFPASQEFETLYKACGVVFACRPDTLFKYRSLVGKKCVAVEINEIDNFDLDYPEDFELCEILIKHYQELNK